MNIEKIVWDWSLIASLASALFALIGCVISLITYKKMTRKRLFCANSVAFSDNGKVVLKIRIRNKGSAIGLDTIALNLRTWNNSPRLDVNYFLKVRRVIKDFLGEGGRVTYASELALKNISKVLPTTLSEEESYLCEIELDTVMQAILDAYESYGSKSFFLLFIYRLKIHVVTGSGVCVFPVDPEAKDYLWRNYKDRPELTS
ncbi:hypothetical protein [Rheinheimera pacifica]|uniref:hypothetical protein n=1 Tax=Rheinheimera pacifica TaxID=173990 RepID=UPI002ED85472